MAPQKDSWNAAEVEALVADARTQMEIEFIQRDFKEHKEHESKLYGELLAKLDLLMANEQIRSKELTDFRDQLKKEIKSDYVTKDELRAMKNSLVWAVAIIVGAGGVAQWLITTYSMVQQIPTH